MISRTPEERMQYEARRKAEMDFKSFVEEAAEEGEARGELRGRKLGLVEQVRLLQTLLREPVSAESDLLAMDLEPLSRLCDELKGRLPLGP